LFILLIVEIASCSSAMNRDYVETSEALRYKNMFIRIFPDSQWLTLNSYKDHRETEDE